MSNDYDKKFEQMLAEFEKQHPTEGKNLRAQLDGDPGLKARLLEATAKGHLEKFEPLDPSLAAKGVVTAYDAETRAIRFSMDTLTNSAKDAKVAESLRISLAHEAEHAIDRDVLMKPVNEKKLETMLSAFEKDHPTEGKNFRALLDTTPELKGRMLEAIDKGQLEKFQSLPPGSDAGTIGVYKPDAKSIHLSMDVLKDAHKNAQYANLMRSTLGHEIEHAVNYKDIKARENEFIDAVFKIATGPSPHNYTEAVKGFNADLRDREARDEMAGVNVLAAHLKRENPTATKEQLYEKLYNASPDMPSYFDVKGKAPNLSYEPKPGIVFNEKFQLEPTKTNIEAFGKHFYDRNGYPADYGQKAIDIVGDMERVSQRYGKSKDPSYSAPEVQIDLSALGLTGMGIKLPPGFKDISPPPIHNLTPMHETQPRERRGASDVTDVDKRASTGDRNLDDLLAALKDPAKLKSAMDALANSSEGQQFQQAGKHQWLEQQGAKQPDAVRPQPAQEAPAQETPARKMGGM